MSFFCRASSTFVMRSSYWTNVRVRSLSGIRSLETKTSDQRATPGKINVLDEVDNDFQFVSEVPSIVLDLVISSEGDGGDDIELSSLSLGFGDLGEQAVIVLRALRNAARASHVAAGGQQQDPFPRDVLPLVSPAVDRELQVPLPTPSDVLEVLVRSDSDSPHELSNQSIEGLGGLSGLLDRIGLCCIGFDLLPLFRAWRRTSRLRLARCLWSQPLLPELAATGVFRDVGSDLGSFMIADTFLLGDLNPLLTTSMCSLNLISSILAIF